MNEMARSPLTFFKDAEDYAKHSTAQQVRAYTALKLAGLKKGDSALDIGCGDGKITNFIALSTAPGNVVGLDISEAMIKKASSDFAATSNLKFILADAANFNLNQQFKLITSFFCLQWVSLQLLPVVFNLIFKHLDDNGILCLLLPCYDFPHEIIKGVAFSEKWKSHFLNFKEQQSFQSANFYNDLLKDKFNLEIEEVESTHPMIDEEFIHYTSQWCGCFQWLKNEKLKQEFIQDIKARLNLETHQDRKFTMTQKSLRIIGEKLSLENQEVMSCQKATIPISTL